MACGGGDVEERGACDDEAGAWVGGAGCELVREVPEVPPDGCEVVAISEVVVGTTHASDELLPMGEVAPAGHSVHKS